MFSKKELMQCATRELQKRRENYPLWVSQSRMKQSDATKQIEMMQVIYRLLASMSDEKIADIQQ